MSFCKLCNNDFETRWKLRKHREVFHALYFVKCEYCPKKFRKEERHREHMKKAHCRDEEEVLRGNHYAFKESFSEVEEREMKMATERKQREDEENRKDVEELLEEECAMMATLERLLENRDNLTEKQIEEYERKLQKLRSDDDGSKMIPTGDLSLSRQQDIELIKALYF